MNTSTTNILSTVLDLNASTERRVSFRYDCFSDMEFINVTIAKSKEEYNEWLYDLNISLVRSSEEQLEEFKVIVSELANGRYMDVQDVNTAYWNNGTSGTHIDVFENGVLVEWMDAGDVKTQEVIK